MGVGLNRRRIMAGLCAAPLLYASGRAFAFSFDANGVARAFADLSRREYHDAAIGDRLAALVEGKIAEGAYSTITSASALAAALMADAAEVTKDKHFYVMAGMHHGMAPSIRPGVRKEKPEEEWLEQMRADRFGIRRAEIIAGGVGVIDLRRFYSPFAETKSAWGAAMAKVASARALVFDLTHNIGGDPAGVAYLSSYLFERAPFVINRFFWRSSGVEEFRTTVDLEGPAFPEERAVIVAVSAETFSAGEEFAYDLKALGRATIIGERTGGGANHAEMFPLGTEIAAFIPCARAENPVTRANWEGTGVEPDVAAGKTDALNAALQLARL